MHLIGLISDTHGMLRSDVFAALADVELILHAGDVGGSAILDELETIAPVRAVFGNTDAPGQPRLAQRVDCEVGGVTIHVSHGHEVGSPTAGKLLAAYDAQVVIYGHTHRALVETHDGRLVVNPGAAGARRFNLLPSVAVLHIRDGHPTAEIISLQP